MGNPAGSVLGMPGGRAMLGNVVGRALGRARADGNGGNDGGSAGTPEGTGTLAAEAPASPAAGSPTGPGRVPPPRCGPGPSSSGGTTAPGLAVSVDVAEGWAPVAGALEAGPAGVPLSGELQADVTRGRPPISTTSEARSALLRQGCVGRIGRHRSCPLTRFARGPIRTALRSYAMPFSLYRVTLRRDAASSSLCRAASCSDAASLPLYRANFRPDAVHDSVSPRATSRTSLFLQHARQDPSHYAARPCSRSTDSAYFPPTVTVTLVSFSSVAAINVAVYASPCQTAIVVSPMSMLVTSRNAGMCDL